MRWRCSPIPFPSENDRRIVRKFAWLPVQIKDHKVWLETYQTVEVYSKRMVWADEQAWWIYEWREMSPDHRETLDYY